MYRWFYEGMTLQSLPLFTLVLFVGVFLTVVGRTFVLRQSRDYDAMAQLPLEDKERHE